MSWVTVCQVLLGMGSKAHESIKIYESVSVISGFLMILGTGASFWHLFVGEYVGPLLHALATPRRPFMRALRSPCAAYRPSRCWHQLARLAACSCAPSSTSSCCPC